MPNGMRAVAACQANANWQTKSSGRQGFRELSPQTTAPVQAQAGFRSDHVQAGHRLSTRSEGLGFQTQSLQHRYV